MTKGNEELRIETEDTNFTKNQIQITKQMHSKNY